MGGVTEREPSSGTRLKRTHPRQRGVWEGWVIARMFGGGEEELLLPLHADLVLGMEKSSRTISLQIPEGLL